MTVLPSPIPHPLDFCPWDLPGWAYEALEWVVGFQWPDGDEKETWDAADRWFALAGVLAGPRDEATEAAHQVISGYGGGGVTAAAFQQAWRNLADGDAPLNSLMEISHELGKMIEECGSDIEGAKLEAWIELGIFVIELIAMAVAVALTLGAASPAAAGLIAATRFAIQQIFHKLLEQLGKKAIKKSLKEAGERATKQLTTKAGLKHLGKGALREGLEEAAEEAAANGAIQVYQDSTGRRGGLDVRELGMSSLGGFAGGFAAGGAQIGRGGRNSVGDALRGAGGEVLGEFGGAAVFGGLPDLEGVAKSASSGVAGSAVHSMKADLGDALSGLDTSGLATPVPDTPGMAGPAAVGPASAAGGPAPATGERVSAAAPVLAEGFAVPDSSASVPLPSGHSNVETSAGAPGLSTEPSPSGNPGPTAGSGLSSGPALGSSSPSGPTFAAGPNEIRSVPGPAPGLSAGHGPLLGADFGAGPSSETSFAGRPGGESGPPSGGPGGGLRTDPPGPPRDSAPAVPGKETALAKAPTLEPPRPVDRIAEALAPRPAKGAAPTTFDLQNRPEPLPAEILASPPPHAAPTRRFDNEAVARAAYFGYLRHARQTHEDLRREDFATHLVSTADLRHSQAVKLGEQAGNALRDGLTLRADRWFAGSRELRGEAADLEQIAGQVRAGEIVPERVDVDGADWIRINHDVGDLTAGPVETDDTSRLTGDDQPPPIDRGRRYGIRGGLRAPLAVHQTDLERAMPRDHNGRVQRQADPRQGDWFSLTNDGGPEADPTRAINCLDGVLSLFDTYVHGRPRVSAPRTFDAYANGDPTRPLGAENDGLARIENTVKGQFQGLCPYVGATDHARAKQSVDLAMTNLSNHLHNLGHGSFAFIVTDSEGGSAHAWTAVNHDGTILFLDPQTRRISETVPLYTNRGAPSEANVVSMDALMVDSAGQYSPLPFHRAGIWSQSILEPTGAKVPIAESDRYDPPGVGYFADLYERFDAASVERGYFDSLPPDQQEVIAQSVLAAEAIADRAQQDLLNAIDSLSGLDDESRPRVVGIEHRTKTSASLARAYTLREDSQSDLETFLNKQKDRVRFSVEVPLEKYEKAVVATLESLKSRGYEAGRIVNFWNDNGRHNGLNITVADSTGSIMEVQFPTRLTGVIGRETHRYYETLRLPDFPTQLRVDAFLRMLAINKRHDLAAQRPPSLSELGSCAPVDTCLARWLTKEEITRDEYEEWLQEHGLTWNEMLERHRLSVEDTYGPSWSERDQ